MSLSKFHHPFEVAGHPQLEPEVKRAILASWASDVRKVENRLPPRHSPSASEPMRRSDIVSGPAQP